MARRSKDDQGEKRTAAIKVQLTPTERMELDLRAALSGRSLSDYSRAVLLSEAARPIITARDPVAVRALAVELARIGNNLNQLTHYAHERRALPPERAVLDVANLITAALEKVMQL
jgi:hypothetical protein